MVVYYDQTCGSKTMHIVAQNYDECLEKKVFNNCHECFSSSLIKHS